MQDVASHQWILMQSKCGRGSPHLRQEGVWVWGLPIADFSTPLDLWALRPQDTLELRQKLLAARMFLLDVQIRAIAFELYTEH